MPFGRQSWRCVLGLALVAVAPPASAQVDANSDRASQTTATLPESNEAGLLTSQIEQAIERGDYRLAIQLAERLGELPEELVAVPASRTYYPVWRQAVRLLEQLPPPGAELYRQLYDPEVAARYRDALVAGDIETLRQLFRVYQVSAVWPDIGRDLVSQLLDRGDFGEAVDVLRALAERSDRDRPQRRAQLVAALAKARAWGAAGAALRALERDEEVLSQPGWRERLQQMRVWLDEQQSAPTLSADDRPRIEGGGLWSYPLVTTPTTASIAYDDDAKIAAAIDAERAWPLPEPVLRDGRLFVRLRSNIWAFDELTLQPLWREQELLRDDSALSELMPGENAQPHEASPDTQLLLHNALRHAVSAGPGAVYTIERLKFWETGYHRFSEQPGNVLVARDSAGGALRWTVGEESNHPLFGAAFQDAPLALERALAVVVEQNNQIDLCLLAPDTGAMLRRIPIVGPPTHLSVGGGRVLLAADETSIYVCTGNGVIAALGRDDLRWKWAATYQSTLPERLGGAFWGARPTPRDYPVCRPVISEDLIVIAPIDGPHLFAIDRFSGRQRWQVSRGPHELLVGAIHGGLVLAGSAISCVDATDGQTLRWRSVPLDLTGRPAVWGDRVYAPTRDGLIALEGRTGKVVACESDADGLTPSVTGGASTPTTSDDRGHEPLRTANLLAAPDGLIAVSPNRVTKLPAPGALAAEIERRLVIDPDDPSALLAGAWDALLSERPLDALELLERIRARDPGISEARERILTHVFVALARRASDAAERMNWLNRAAVLASSPEIAGRLARLISEALEESADVDGLLAHCSELLERSPELSIRDASGTRSTAAWLYAVERVNTASRTYPQAAAQVFGPTVRNAVGRNDSLTLLRLRPLISDPALIEQIDSALAESRAAPELLAPYLLDSEQLNTGVGGAARLLARWNADVALGRLAAAKEDEKAWRSLIEWGSAQPTATRPEAGDSAPTDEQRQIAQRIERSAQKLRDSAAPPLGEAPRRQWNPAAELIEDPRNPLLLSRTFVPARALDSGGARVLQLRNTASGDPQRQTEDAALSAPHSERQILRADFAGNRPVAWQTPETTWPAATWGDLAAIPSRGGLVGVGLGPERGGGQRIWEFLIPDWSEPPPNAGERMVAGPLGVYIAPRPDRVMLVGWADGEVWWQVDLPEFPTQRLDLADGRLIIVGPEQQVLSIDATFGGDPQQMKPESGAPRAIRVTANRVILATDRAIMALDPATLEPVWSRPQREFGAWQFVTGAPWAFIHSTGSAWQLIDLANGELLFSGRVDQAGDVLAAAADAGVLYVVALASSTAADPDAPNLRLSAFDRGDGAQRWSIAVRGLPPVHATQLIGNPDYIPILELAEEGGDRVTLANLVLHLVRKKDGSLAPATPIGARFEGIEPTASGILTLASPTRVIIQVGGRLVAFGDANLEQVP